VVKIALGSTDGQEAEAALGPWIITTNKCVLYRRDLGFRPESALEVI
jgi:hypothetical protein